LGLLQGWQDIGAMGILSLLCFIWAGHTLLSFWLLTCTFISLISSGSGGRAMNSSPAASPARWLLYSMDTSTFRQHLDNSLKLLLDITRQHCYNDISEDFKFIIQPSGTDFHDGLNDYEKKNLTILNQFGNRLLTAEQVIDLLYHDNKVPLWINATIYESKKDLTVIHLFCSRRLRHDNDLFHQAVKYPPFNVLVPLPPDPLRKEINGKFDINWKKQLDDRQKPKSILKRIKQFLTSDK